jgi:hypothetical protein
LDSIERLNLTFSGGLIAASLAATSLVFTLSIALGAVIEAVNYRMLRRSTDALFSGHIGGGRAWTGGFALRFVGVGAALAVAIFAGAHPVGLVLGVSIIVPAAVVAAWRTPPPVVEGPPAAPPDDPSWDDWNPWLARERDAREDEE